jgi:hypothetical protein
MLSMMLFRRFRQISLINLTFFIGEFLCFFRHSNGEGFFSETPSLAVNSRTSWVIFVEQDFYYN